ncbi:MULTISPECIES: hypothetical protein [Lactococcus]|uniref:Uncharacterized protein n=1 Tax=Lactococcus lactis subsp. lactis TaxID=1360 RepID=A0AA34T7A0_LACLL|nr:MULTISPECIES: hypothetical protein [Lactococcus]ARD95100.1 hypothetical protein LL229_0208 [Lactococcus lactis subsp. lactis]ARE07330.1 hypothetical protein LLUC77_0208 [Lactococcus lactis subsp. lactis]MCT0080518.1 hypothetical protein [Lactococcus lactis subsp. lactis]MCT0488438.1 hypothetical protein [Lactococcus cremoris]MDM7474348.1 hypothetical protein [Lactococcus lactis]
MSKKDEISRIKQISDCYDIKLNIIPSLKNNYPYVRELVNSLRSTIMIEQSKKSSKAMKSPEFNRGQKTSNSYFSYERGYQPYKLEQLIRHLYESEYVKSIVTRSGMSSIDLAIKSASFFLSPKPLKVFSLYSYFETTGILSQYQKMGTIKYHKFLSFKKFIESIKKEDPDLIYLENPQALSSHPCNNIEYFFSILDRMPATKFRIVIIDSTLSGPLKNLKKFIKINQSNLMIVDIVSGIKFYNLGLELSNLGIMNIWTKSKKIRNNFATNIKNVRSLSGQSIQPIEESMLMPIFKNLNLVNDHYDAILNNSLHYQKYFYLTKILPRISRTPILYIENKAMNGTDINKIVHGIHDKLHLRGLELSTGDSFGFHLTRIQAIHTEEKRHLIRICPGSFFSEVDKFIIKEIIKKFKDEDIII